MNKTKILVNQTAFLGDLLLSIPLLKNLRKIFPASEITLICRKGTASLMKELSVANEVIEIDKKNSESKKLLNDLIRTRVFDIAISPHESPRSAIFMWKLKADVKVGFRKWWNGFIYNRRQPRNMDLPDALRQLSLLSDFDSTIREVISSYLKERKAFGKLRVNSLTDRLKVPVIASMGFKTRIQANPLFHIVQKFPETKDAILIAPGSVWNTKRWTPEGYTNLAKKLSLKNQVVLIGSPDEKELCDQIQKQAPEVFNIAGKVTLFELL